ncbi:unnamed protein product [Lactuca virosa]|uniref:TIR domain-containing protein n=1 Tax=Lactuca virosa TaxID=75947 RepID=A0AAU9N9S8_9ASTR|nr:unnamed protein product [Lactuca virosa]
MECQDENEQIAYPLFYDVEPSDIRKRSGPVKTAISKHKTNEHIEKWEKALESAGNLVGWDLKNIANGHETEAIKKIAEEISLKLRSIHLSNDENLIGMDRRMQELESSLGISLNDKARMIGIKGMGGIGKTTLARSIFNKVSSLFEGSCFVDDVREVSKKKGLRSLQKRVLSDVLNIEHKGSVLDGEKIMRMRLRYIKVLLALDDVDNPKQLEAFAGDWFKDGSRIIITTRDKKVLLAHGVNAKWIHDVDFLSDEEAMSLFSRYAFKRYIPDKGFEKLSSEVVRYSAGLPLTIKVLGSHLRGEEEVVWIDGLKRLETIPSLETLEVLEISYDGLEDDLKEIFLDVACFMVGFPKDDAIRAFDSCGFRGIYGLRVLEQKSLITILHNGLGMHDRIEELGKNIVRQSHPREPNKHSRLWIREEIEELFTDDVGTEASTCTGLELELTEVSPEIIIKGLGNLKKLRYIFLTGSDDDCFPSDWKFDQEKQYFPNSLQLLNWNGYPGRFLPQTFQANNLVALQLPDSRIVQLWEGRERKVLKKLRFLDLSCSNVRTFDFGMTPNLKRLELRGCHDLIQLHVPPGCLKRLVYLDLLWCSSSVSFSFIKQLESLELFSLPDLLVSVVCLEEFPRYSRNNLPKLRFIFDYSKEQSSSNGTSLECVLLDLQPCTKLEHVSESICGLQHIRCLTLDGCIPEVPKDIDQLKCLEELTLYSTHLICLPDSVCMLKHLKSLKIKDCRYLEELPENLGLLEHLEELSLSSTSIRRLPDSICMLKQLLSLKLKSCLLLQELPNDLGQLDCLEKLNLLSTGIRSLPDSICMLKHLQFLNLESCQLLEKIPEDIGQLECLEELNLTECESLEDIPNSICKMKCLRYFYLPFCSRVQKLPEELGSLECLEELDINCTGISHLPHSICLLKDLRIVGSESVLQSCAFEIQTSETETSTQALDNTAAETKTGLRNQLTENYCNRWCWSVVMVLVVALLVMQVVIQVKV